MSSKPWHDERQLRKLYHEDNLSTLQIAERWGCSKTTILNWMEKHGVERREPLKDRPPGISMHQNGYEKVAVTIDGESREFLLHRLFAVSKYGFNAVAGREVHHKKNIPWLNTPANIELVSKKDHPSEHATNSETPWKDKERLSQMMETHTQTELAEKWDCNQSMISRWLKRHGLR